MITRLSRRLGAAVFVAMLAGATGANADPQQDAVAITQGIEGFLALISQQNQAIGVTHDKVAVTPDGAAFNVAITGMQLGSGAAGLAIGEVDYRLEPQMDGTYKVSDPKLAKEMPVTDPDGKPAGTLSFETTAFSGIWSGTVQSFLSLDWQAKDVVATALEEPKAVIKVAQASLNAEGKDAGNGRLDETVTYTLTDIAATDPDGAALKLGKLSGHLNLQAFDFPGYRAQMQKLRDLAQKYGTDKGPPPDLSDEDRADIVAVAKALPGLIAGYDFTLTTDDASVGPEGSVKHGELGLAMTGISGDAATLQLHIKQVDLATNDPDLNSPLGQALFPKSLDLNLTLDQVPVAAATENLAQAMTSGGALAQDPASLFMMSLMSAIGSAPLSLTIAPSTIETAKGQFVLDGKLSSANGSPFGKVNVAASGLAAIIATVEAAAKDDPDAKEILDALHQVQAAAEHGTGADGKPVEKFLIEMTPSGEMQVNGKPLNGL